jgi:pyruvate formate lyase activating enzyme
MTDIAPYIFKIQRYSIHDGPGIRTTLFFQGCPLSCSWCHNPESQAPWRPSSQAPGLAPSQTSTQVLISPDKIKDLVKTLVWEIKKDNIFFDESNGGVTFSGGEPLSCPELLMPLLDACGRQEIHTCLDTSGFAPFEVLKAAATRADLVLYDIKILDEKAHLNHTGKPVGMILDNLKKLSHLKINLKLRFPLIPTMTDTDENIYRIIEFLIKETRYRDIHILPFHNTGEGKYEILKMENQLKHLSPPTAEHVEIVRQIFVSSGFHAIIGG